MLLDHPIRFWVQQPWDLKTFLLRKHHVVLGKKAWQYYFYTGDGTYCDMQAFALYRNVSISMNA